MPVSLSPVASTASGWTATHHAVAVAVADAAGIPVPAQWASCGPGVDWSRFAALVAGHGVAPLVRRSGWLASQPVPSAVDARLHVLARRGISANLRNLAALSEIVAAADRDGVDIIVLEGPPLAAWAYGDPLARHASHLRLLVDPASVAEAAGLLAGLGFEAIGPQAAPVADAAPGDAEVTFVRGSTFVDLRWRLFANVALLTVDLADPRNRLCVDVSGFRVTTLAREPMWWYLAVHGTQLRWSSLRWVADVPAVLRACPGLAAPAALDRAAEAGVDRCVATALRLAGEVLGMGLPDGAAAWIGARPGSERLAQQSLRYLAATLAPEGGRAPARLVERATFALGMRQDGRYRRATIRLAVAQSAHEHLAPLAERLARWRPGPLRWLANRTVRSSG